MTAEPRIRLDQLMSRYGYCSRGQSRAWVKTKRITIAGVPAKDPSEKVLISQILIDGEPVECPNGVLVVLNKPAGYTCTHDLREGASVYELLPPRWVDRNPPVTTVGRLDKDTTGVLVVTDHGDLVHRWTSPRHKISKVYEITVGQELDDQLIPLFASGSIVLPGEIDPCLPAKLEILTSTTARLELVEGRYHQVKRMFASEGYEVLQLHRSRFGDFELKGLAPGQWRFEPRIERPK